jgi:hypothetical protein
MQIIKKVSEPIEKADLYFAIDPDNLEKPFILGGCCNDPSLPSIAQWAAASTFGLDNLDNISGSKWKDWRGTLHQLNCDWVISIIEEAEKTRDIKAAVGKILDKQVVKEF